MEGQSSEALLSEQVSGSSLAPKGIAHRHIFAATLGNALEFYDFTVYGFFAIQIGHAFFPAQGPFASLMLSLATFGAGFLTRPIGGVVIGAYADRAGRRSAMMLSFMMMGLAVVALALIPSYAVIGIAAPILAVVARMVQGFSLGGEVGPNTAYLLEGASPNRRGVTVSWQGASQQISMVVGASVGLILATLMRPEALNAYGWRIAFLIGALTLPVGLILRRTMPETLHAPEGIAAIGIGSPPLRRLRDNRRVITLGLMMLGSGTIFTYVSNYMTTYAQNTLHVGLSLSFAATLVPAVSAIPAFLLGGRLSDSIGRRPVMVGSKCAQLLLTLPIFFWIVGTRSATALLGGMAVLTFVSGLGGGVVHAALCESLPKAIRGRGFAAIYATAIAVFGGTTQFVITWLIHVTGNPMAPAWYLIGSSLVGLIAMTLFLESAPARLPVAPEFQPA